LHTHSIEIQVSTPEPRDRIEAMLRKLLWTAIYGGLSALATMASRRGAAVVWRSFTGEDPPSKK
jgi:hypothetical protein